ncbi:MAG: HD domain-containing protein [Sphingomonadales bacterium]|nr:HD domain-containing protein [Sphingomonadales bacterium]
MNKHKIINDPIYGFIRLNDPLLFDLLEHPLVQRLREIRQLGMSYLVYPGATHSRLAHALGAMHLMQQVINILRDKGIDIPHPTGTSACAAILLHDVGHGPFSHALEHLVGGPVSHEYWTRMMMEHLNASSGGVLSEAIDIFEGAHPLPFLHQLVSSQLDVDRLDYLNRDSFFTGVSEGIVGWDRLIQMMHVHQGQLVVEEKGIYSVEKFLLARRLMYWQVYQHKTVLSAEFLMRHIVERARELLSGGHKLTGSDALILLLKQKEAATQERRGDLLTAYAETDDHDFITAVKEWSRSSDWILLTLCQNLLNRKLNRVLLTIEKPYPSRVEQIRNRICDSYGISAGESRYFLGTGSIVNHALHTDREPIYILGKNRSVKEITEASQNPHLKALTGSVEKHYLYAPKDFL